MKIIHQIPESEVLGFNVFGIEDWDSVDELLSELNRIAGIDTKQYFYCQVPATDLLSIHKLEEHGFRFSEFRIHSILQTEDAEIYTRLMYPYEARLIGDKDDLNKAMEILGESTMDDRFSNDPLLTLNSSFERNKNNLIKSFNNPNQEFLLGIYNVQSGKLCAFRSGGYISSDQAHLYQCGVSNTCEKYTMTGILESLTIQFLKLNGIRLIHAVSTGFSIIEINHLTKNHGFNIASGNLIFRLINNK